MKTELKLASHDLLNATNVVEVWHDGKFMAAIYGTVGPGVKLITKHHATVTPHLTEELDGLAEIVIELKPTNT